MKHEAAWIKDESRIFSFLSAELPAHFSGGDSVLVKLHMGEPGNEHYIKAPFAAKIIEVLQGIGCRPFIFDTPVVYKSRRGTVEGYIDAAAEHGYRGSSVKAPVVISNDSVRIRGAHMDYLAASRPLEADGVFILSHFKGHVCCGIGGAIKNVGMGCMAKETKSEIHGGGEPVYGGGCTQCGICADSCPTENIRLDDERPWFDATWCCGCSNCTLACPAGCLTPRREIFDILLAESAVLAHGRFRKTYAMTVMKRMTKLCDCMADAGPLVADDAGYVFAPDMLTADMASLMILEKTTGCPDIFGDHNLTSSWGHVRAAAGMMGRKMEIGIRTVS